MFRIDLVRLQGANRRQVNSLVYARVSLAHKDMEPELECFDAQTRKAEGFGELKGGFLVRCSLKMSRKWVKFFTNCFGSRRVSQLIESKLLPSASPWVTLPSRYSIGHEWEGLD
jgi:hypothetical protein